MSSPQSSSLISGAVGSRCYPFLPVPHAPIDPRHLNLSLHFANATTLTRMILAGLAGIVVIEIYAAVMQRQFQNTDNKVGKGFAVLGIYLFVVTYCTFLPFRVQNE